MKMSGLFEKTIESLHSLLSPLASQVALSHKYMYEKCFGARTKRVSKFLHGKFLSNNSVVGLYGMSNYCEIFIVRCSECLHIILLLFVAFSLGGGNCFPRLSEDCSRVPVRAWGSI